MVQLTSSTSMPSTASKAMPRVQPRVGRHSGPDVHPRGLPGACLPFPYHGLTSCRWGRELERALLAGLQPFLCFAVSARPRWPMSPLSYRQALCARELAYSDLTPEATDASTPSPPLAPRPGPAPRSIRGPLWVMPMATRLGMASWLPRAVGAHALATSDPRATIRAQPWLLALAVLPLPIMPALHQHQPHSH